MKIEGPCLSLGAHGTIAKAITFSMRGGNARAAIYRKPHDAGTQTQLNQRAHYLDGARLWKFMTDADRLAWTQTHQRAESSASGYNLFLQTILKREADRFDWQHPLYFTDSWLLPNFWCILPFELRAGNRFYDISGNHRHWNPSNVNRIQGPRAYCAHITASIANTDLEGSTTTGDLEKLTVGVRFYPTQAFSAYSTVAYIARKWEPHAGFTIRIYIGDIWFSVGKEPTTHALIVPYEPVLNRWHDLICTFDGADNGHMRILIDGDEIGSVDSNLTAMGATAYPLALAKHAIGSYFHGRLDNFFFYKGLTDALRI